MERTYRAQLPETSRASLNLLEHGAARWGAEWERRGDGGRLRLPVMAGLRRGWLDGVVTATEREVAEQSLTRLELRVEESEWHTDRTGVMVLCCALFGALITIVAPFFPRLWGLVPFGIVLAAAAWFFVLAKLRNSGPEEFLESVVDDAGGEVLGQNDDGDDNGEDSAGSES